MEEAKKGNYTVNGNIRAIKGTTNVRQGLLTKEYQELKSNHAFYEEVKKNNLEELFLPIATFSHSKEERKGFFSSEVKYHSIFDLKQSPLAQKAVKVLIKKLKNEGITVSQIRVNYHHGGYSKYCVGDPSLEIYGSNVDKTFTEISYEEVIERADIRGSVYGHLMVSYRVVY